MSRRQRKPRLHENLSPASPRPRDSGSDPGLIGWLENTRVKLPLRAIDCCFDVHGMIAEVEVCQVFVQANPKVLDCVYSFAVPAGASVHRCVIDINGRRITARAEEREKARRIAKEKAAQGHRTALVESERENLFTLTLGNVAPGDVVTVRLSWFQVVERLGDERSLCVPFTPGIRFIPGKPLLRENRGFGVSDDTDEVPDASRISPPRIGGDHPDAATLFVSGKIRHPEATTLEVTSPSDLLLVAPEKGETLVKLAGSETSQPFPDADFVVRWTETCDEPSGAAGTGWYAGSDDGYEYALIHLVAPQVEKPADFSQDVFFLVDRSGSMGGTKWTQAARALNEFVGLLGTGDRVFITLFETSHQDFAEAPMPAGDIMADRNFRSIAGMGTGGGTNLLPALQHQLEVIERHSKDREVSVVLITDGQVGNEQAVFDALTGRDGIRFHTFGIDTNVNDSFLRRLARDHRGTCCLRTPDDGIAEAVAELGRMIGSPALRSLDLEIDWETPGGLPGDLYSGQSLTLSIRRRQGAPMPPKEVVLKAVLPSKEEVRLPVGLAPSSSPAIPLFWVRERIDQLLAERKREEAIELAVGHNLICDGVAFVAWDEAEKVAVSGPVDTLVQPSPEPPMLRARMLQASSPRRRNRFDDGTLHSSPDIVSEPSIDDPLLHLVLRLVACGCIPTDQAADVYLALSSGSEDSPSMARICETLVRLIDHFEELDHRSMNLGEGLREARRRLRDAESGLLLDLAPFFEMTERMRSEFERFHRLVGSIGRAMSDLPPTVQPIVNRSLENMLTSDRSHGRRSSSGLSEELLRRKIESRLEFS